MRKIKIGKKYKHFKGNIYKVVDIVYDAESHDDKLNKIVIYEAQSKDKIKWARPYDNFNSEVDHDKYPEVKQVYRFEELED